VLYEADISSEADVYYIIEMWAGITH